MANSLGRKIKKGEEVVVKGAHIPVIARVFICESGFGMSHMTAGRKIFGKWVRFEIDDCITGYDIDREETKRWQNEPDI